MFQAFKVRARCAALSAGLAAALVSGALVSGAAGVQAATVSFSALPGQALKNPAAIITGTVFEEATGSVGGIRRSPWESAGSAVNFNAADALYTSVSAGATALYRFGGVRSTLSFVWGSPDTYNLLTFFLGKEAVDTVALRNGDPIAPATFGTNSGLATITGIARGGKFDAVAFSSGSNAFEYANVAAVPLPAAGVLMLGALAGLGLLRRRARA